MLATNLASNLPLAYTLIVLGFLLLAAELFVPSGGILFVLSVGSLGVGVAMTFFYDPTLGFATLLGVFVALPIVGSFLLSYWPKTPLGRRFFLSAPDETATMASLPLNQELEQLRGRFGRALSDLRPSGVVDFDGRRVDTITEGMMVDAGSWVRCIDVKAGKVVVRPVEKPELNTLENADFG